MLYFAFQADCLVVMQRMKERRLKLKAIFLVKKQRAYFKVQMRDDKCLQLDSSLMNEKFTYI